MYDDDHRIFKVECDPIEDFTYSWLFCMKSTYKNQLSYLLAVPFY